MMSHYADGQWLTLPQALAPHVDVLRGIDISDAMVEGYNHMARAAGRSEVMYAVQGDLLTNEEIEPAEEFSNFDVAVISMALHHVASPQELLSKLVARLQHDGVVVVLDWTPGATGQEPVKHHDVHATISKGSFSKADMIEMFTDAGCKGVGIAYHEYKETTFIPGHLSGVDGGVEKRVFLAWARRE
jgi:SAM-dependent methyltransferase